LSNGPYYGCIHAGIALGYDIQPGQTVSRQGTIVLGRMEIQGFMARYQEDLASWSSRKSKVARGNVIGDWCSVIGGECPDSEQIGRNVRGLHCQNTDHWLPIADH